MFQTLDHGIDAFGSGIGDRVHQIVQDALAVFFDHVSGFGQRTELRGPCGFHPVPQELEGPRLRGVAPKSVEVFLQRPCGPGLQVLDQQAAEPLRGLAAQILMATQPKVFAVFKSEVPGGAELAVFLTADASLRCFLMWNLSKTMAASGRGSSTAPM